MNETTHHKNIKLMEEDIHLVYAIVFNLLIREIKICNKNAEYVF